MSAFLEDRLPMWMRLGASWGEDFAVEVTRTASGAEYRKLLHPYPVLSGAIRYTQDIAPIWDEVLSLYRRVYGRFAGFRVRARDNWSTNGGNKPPTAADQVLELVEPGVYQLVARYGQTDPLLDIGAPARIIHKPVAGTVLLAVGGIATSAFTVDVTTGRVTLAANKTAAVTAIAKGAATVVTVGANTFVVGESVQVSGVVGMTEINGQRAPITGRTETAITLALDSSAWSDYASGGVVNTAAQDGEVVTGGCEFDIPCRFDSAIDLTSLSVGVRDTSEIHIVEILNP